METININGKEIEIKYVSVSELINPTYNPRKWDDVAKKKLKESLTNFGFIDPVILNKAQGRENIIIGGNFRVEAAKELGIEKVPAVYVDIPDQTKEKELCIRLNRNTGEFDYDLLSAFDETFLADIGFNSEELDEIFEDEPEEEVFDLQKELNKLGIEVEAQKGEIYDLDGSRLMIGDSTAGTDMLALMGNEKADMVMTDPPYILDYLHGKTRQGEATVGFGSKKNRRYLETETLPENFTELWMNNVAKVAQKDFSIIVYENWKNMRTIWNEMQKHWKVRNMLIWHLPNRNQGYAGKSKFFSKYDIAMVGTGEEFTEKDAEYEGELFENEYDTALFAISGKPHWESYGKGKKYCPTDHIDFNAADEESSGQAIIFGTKPIEILIPYIRVLTKRDQLVLEPFGGSGSTLIASTKIGRRCFIMEKSPVYAEVIMNRWEKATGKTRQKISCAK